MRIGAMHATGRRSRTTSSTRSQRSRTTRSLEVRLASADTAAPGAIAWLAGVYALDVDEAHERRPRGRVHRSVHAGVLRHDRLSPAQPLRRAQRRRLRPAGRIVRRDAGDGRSDCAASTATADYQDSGIADGEPRATDADETDTMWGGQATVHFDPARASAHVRDVLARLQGRRFQSRAGRDHPPALRA